MKTLSKQFSIAVLVSLIACALPFYNAVAQSNLDSLRRESLRAVFPHLEQIQELQETIRKDVAHYSDLQFLLQIDKNWLEKALFSTYVTPSWRKLGKTTLKGKSPELFSDHAYFRGELATVSSFFQLEDIALLVLNLPEKSTVLVLNRAGYPANAVEPTSAVSFFAISEDLPVKKPD